MPVRRRNWSVWRHGIITGVILLMSLLTLRVLLKHFANCPRHNESRWLSLKYVTNGLVNLEEAKFAPYCQ